MNYVNQTRVGTGKNEKRTGEVYINGKKKLSIYLSVNSPGNEYN